MLARCLVTVVAAGVLVALSGCTSAEYKQQRLENLNAAIEEFDAASLGDVLCDVHGGEVALGRLYVACAPARLRACAPAPVAFT